MKISDYQKVIALWQNAEGVKLRDADSKNGIEIMIGIIEKRIKFFLFKNMYHHNYKFINLFII